MGFKISAYPTVTFSWAITGLKTGLKALIDTETGVYNAVHTEGLRETFDNSNYDAQARRFWVTSWGR